MPQDENAVAEGGDSLQETLAQTLQRALQHHSGGELTAAEALYMQILRTDPDNPFALHLLGVAAHQTGKPEIAETHITRAIALKPDFAEAYCNLGNALQELGRFDEAMARYQEAIGIAPDFAEAHGNLGNALRHLGQHDHALASYRKAVEIDPRFAGAQGNLGDIYLERGQLDDAVTHYRHAVAAAPEFADAHGNLGNSLQALGRREEAVASYRNALAVEPDFAEVHAGLANTLRELGRLDEAAASYRAALERKPDDADAQCNLGVTMQKLGWLDDAASCYRKAIALRPGFADAHGNLGAALKSLGRLDEAIAQYRTALDLNPDFAEAHGNLGVALFEAGDPKDALVWLRRAIALDPANELFWSGLAVSLGALPFDRVDDATRQNLWDLLDRPTVMPAQILRLAVATLRHDPEFETLLARTGDDSTVPAARAGRIAQLSANALLLKFMASNVMCDLEIEALLTDLRRSLLDPGATGAPEMETGLPLFSALALHCFTNEYIFPESAEETAAVDDLCAQLEELAAADGDIPEGLLVTVAAYRPLHQLPCAPALRDRSWTPGLETLIVRQLAEPQEERAIAASIPRLTSIDNAVSQAVRDQYEENPYPRWIKANLRESPGTIRARLQASPLGHDLGDYVSPDQPDILIAGCGTGQQSLAAASRFADAGILAVDLSVRSLSYAIRKTREHGFTNIEYAQADILALGDLDRRFDLIECTGVLHHLEDPMAGWRVLVSLLRPGGLMKIGLYGDTGRRNILRGRARAAEKGYAATPTDIRRCRQDIAAAAGDGAMRALLGFNDFFSLSECRDLLFHVQEHHVTLPQIDAVLTALGLAFVGFDGVEQDAIRRFKALHPATESWSSLDAWHRFETGNPDTFGSMYQFWCRKTP